MCASGCPPMPGSCCDRLRGARRGGSSGSRGSRADDGSKRRSRGAVVDIPTARPRAEGAFGTRRVACPAWIPGGAAHRRFPARLSHGPQAPQVRAASPCGSAGRSILAASRPGALSASAFASGRPHTAPLGPRRATNRDRRGDSARGRVTVARQAPIAGIGVAQSDSRVSLVHRDACPRGRASRRQRVEARGRSGSGARGTLRRIDGPEAPDPRPFARARAWSGS